MTDNDLHEGDFCPACWNELLNWSVSIPECETCGAKVSIPLDAAQIEIEKKENVRIDWNEGLREIF